MDIIERLNDPEMYVDAVDDAAREIETLRARVAELEAAQQSVHPTVLCTCKLPGLDANNPAICPTCGKPHSG